MATKKKSKKVPKKKKKAASKKAKSTKPKKSKAKEKAKAKPKSKAKSKPKAKPQAVSAVPKIDGTLLGRVEDFYAQIGVIALTLKSSVKVGDTLHIKGHTTDSIETVVSIQIEHESLQSANKGDSVGIKISNPARRKDWVFRTS